MEADWEIEIGPSAPVIDALWEGYIDLGLSPEKITDVEETHRLPTLAQALLSLNHFSTEAEGVASLWTSKCDLWETDCCDPYEMNADPDEAKFGLACYIDLLPRATGVFPDLQEAQHWSRTLTARLRETAGRCCRVDLLVRSAVAGERGGFGVTAYFTGCGADPDSASEALGVVLHAFVEVTMSQPRR